MKSRVVLVVVTVVAAGAVGALLVGGVGATADEVWSNTYEVRGLDGTTAGTDDAHGVVEAADGGYVVAGDTFGSNDSTFESFSHAFLLKTDTDGNRVWAKTYGETAARNRVGSVAKTDDGGYIISGRTNGYDDFLAGWLIKTDADGNELWNETYGGPGANSLHSVASTPDGGYVAVGETSAYSSGRSDFWMVKTDADGNEEWNRSLGGEEEDLAQDVVVTNESIAVAGQTTSFTSSEISDDGYLVTTTMDGTIKLNETYGAVRSQDRFAAITATSDGGFALAGRSSSYSEDDTDTDAWLLKTAGNGTEMWNRSYGNEGESAARDTDEANDVVTTVDGGFMLAGQTEPDASGPSDAWAVKTDASGTELWDTRLGGEDSDTGRSIVATSDDRYVMAMQSVDASGNFDARMVKFNDTERISPTPTATATPAATPTPDSTPAESPGTTPTPAPGATTTPDDAMTAGSDATDTATGTETPGESGPGFGILLAVVAVVALAVVGRRTR